MSVDAAARDAQINEIRASVKALCARYGEEYWLKLDATHDYPTEFVRELTTGGISDGADSGRRMAVPDSACSRRRQSWKRSAGPARMPVRVMRRCT